MLNMLIKKLKSVKMMSLHVLIITSVFTVAGLVMGIKTVLMAVMRERRSVRKVMSVRVMRLSVRLANVFMNMIIVMRMLWRKMIRKVMKSLILCVSPGPLCVPRCATLAQDQGYTSVTAGRVIRRIPRTRLSARQRKVTHPSCLLTRQILGSSPWTDTA